MVEVYIGNKVKDLIAFHKPVLDQKLAYHSILDQIVAFGNHAFNLFQTGDHRSLFEFNNYNPKYIGKTVKEIIQSKPTLEDFLETSASSFSYKSFEASKTEGDLTIDIAFEIAIDTLLVGDLVSLERQITLDPTLLTRNSQYGHRAGLIHYVGSNGVEAWRQVVPHNLTDILKLLLSKGADPDMWNNIYGSPSTLKGLIETSAHPYQAGLTPDLIKLL